MKRIGFVLASIHKGSTSRLWNEIASLARRDSAGLFIFPVGRLEFPHDFEYLRQNLIPLVNDSNLDVLISWSSSLGGYVSYEDLIAFHGKHFQLPFVTLGMKVPNHPSVTYDAYSGMKKEICHMIEVHGAKKIAFLRAPEWHESGMYRYNAYLDALKSYGIQPDLTIVSSPQAWSDGRKAIKEILDRDKLPGRDFDTVIASSDLMMFDASEYLSSLGYETPNHYHIAGFNNSPEAHLNRASATTVELPYHDMGIEGWRMAMELLEGKCDVKDNMLPCRLIVRRSCGCNYSFITPAEAAKQLHDVESYVGWIMEIMDLSPEKLSVVKELVSLAFCIDVDYAQKNRLFMDHIEAYLMTGKEIREYAGTTLLSYFGLLNNRANRVREHKSNVERDKLNSLKCELLCTRSVRDICQILSRHLPDLGIQEAYLVINEGESESHFVGGFCNSIFLEGVIDFNPELLLPTEINTYITSGVHVVEQLFMENQPLGYVVFKIDKNDGVLLEELQSSLSSAIKGSFLLDSLKNAKEKTEAMERNKSAMFIAISTGIQEPLENIEQKVRNIEFVMPLIDPEIKKIRHLLELSMEEVGDFSAESRFYCLNELFNSEDVLPLAFIDKEKIGQLLELLKSVSHGYSSISFDCLADGFSFKMKYDDFSDTIYSEPALLLSERIVLLHDGRMRIGEDAVEVFLPWCGLNNGHRKKSKHMLRRLNDLPDGLNDLPVLSRDDIESNRSLAVAIDFDCFSFEDYKTVGMLKKMDDVLLIPYCSESGFRNIEELMHVGFGHDNIGSVLFFSSLPVLSIELGEGIEQCTVTSFSDLYKSISNNKSDMIIIFDKVTVEEIISIRRITSTPIIVFYDSEGVVLLEGILAVPGVICVSSCLVQCDEFISRLQRIILNGELLSVNTGALVKKALAFIEKNISHHISRWQVADEINVNEDYMTRIFKKELGISPWEYVNRYKIHVAMHMLRESGRTVSEIAYDLGFQDQAYFCRVYKKIKGISPSMERRLKMVN